jgi:hypothetical protein
MKKRKEDYEKGVRLEDKFETILQEEYGLDTSRSTRDQDRLEGWDIYVGEYMHEDANVNIVNLLGSRIDVKGIKGDGYTWLELLAYSSQIGDRKLGWLLRGKADYIAFERANDFLVIKKSNLKDFVYNKISLLQELEDKTANLDASLENKERWFCNDICAAWGLFDMIDDRHRKDEALYEILYTRWQYDHMPDLLFKIKDSDLVNMSDFIIKKR